MDYKKSISRGEMKIPKKKKYNPNLEEEIPYFNRFIDRYSDHLQSYHRNKLIYFMLYLKNKKKKTILEAQAEDILDFFANDINLREVAAVTKNKWRELLNMYYKYVEEIKKKIEKVSFINPVPSRFLYEFSEKKGSIDDLEKETDLLSYPIIETVLNFLYSHYPRIFIAVALIVYSGARVSEVARIELNNLDLEERYYYTKVKSKKSKVRYGIYFFPKFFICYLRNYIKILKLEYPDAIYLFEYVKGRPITTKTIREHLQDVKNIKGITAAINPHAFRDFINSIRFDNDMGEKFRFLLLNQTPPNVNVGHYIKKYKKRQELLKLYDKTFPFPEFIPKE